jgi:hypothetical protein
MKSLQRTTRPLQELPTGLAVGRLRLGLADLAVLLGGACLPLRRCTRRRRSDGSISSSRNIANRDTRPEVSSLLRRAFHNPDEEAERQFATAIDWGRYAELFEYDAQEKRLTISTEE